MAQAASYSPLHQLPSPPAAFTGRDEELADLVKQLTTNHAAGATISGARAGLQGTGGVGKSALAVVLAHRLKDLYLDAQIVLNLRGAGADQAGRYHATSIKPLTPVEAMQSVIHCFHPEEKLPDDLEKLTGDYLSVLQEEVEVDGKKRPRRVLLLLDNAADADQVRPLLPPPNCLLLVTSRAQFHLPGFETRNLDCLKLEKAREFLLELAPRMKGHEKEAAELSACLPLALLAIAGAANDNSILPMPELLDLFRTRRKKLDPVDAAFQVSYELLAEELRRRWTLLAVFPASFDLRAAAAAVWETSLNPQPSTLNLDNARDAMQALVNASLVEWNETNGRFRLHDLVRQFCDGKLSEAERTAAQFRHARQYRDVMREADALYTKGGENVKRGLELFDRERAHLEAAFAWLQPRRDHESAALVVSLVDAVLYTGQELRFHPRQRIRWLESQRDAARITKHREAEDTALGNLGTAYADLGDARKAIEFYEQQLVIVREIGDRRGEGAALGNLGSAYAALGNARKAIEFYEQQLVIVREIGDRRGEGNALGNLGNAYAALGDARKALEFYEQRLVIAREIGDRRGEGNSLWNFALALEKLGDRAQAIAHAEGALQIFEAIEDPNAAKVRARLAKWRGENK